jgi:hypothetical protein
VEGPARGILGRTLLPCSLLLLAWLVHWRAFAPLELGQDGYLSVDLALGSLSDMVSFLARDVHPPLFYALLHAWLRLFGVNYIAAKYIPIACSILSLALCFRIGLQLIGRMAAFIAVILLLLSPSYVLLSSTVRDFSTGLFFSLFTLSLTVTLLNQKGERHVRAFYIAFLFLSTALSTLTWYLHFFFLGAEILVVAYCVLHEGTKKRGGRERDSTEPIYLIYVITAGVLVCSPWYVDFYSHIQAELARGATAHDATIGLISGISQAISGSSEGSFGLLFIVVWVIPVVIGAYHCIRADDLRVSGRERRLAGSVLIGGILVGVAGEVALAVLWSGPGTMNRYILAIVPAGVLLQSVALVGGRRPLRLTAAVSLIILVSMQTHWFVALAGAPPIAWGKGPLWSYLDTHVEASDEVVFSDHAQRAQYLLSRWGPRIASDVVESQGPWYLVASRVQAEDTISRLGPMVQRLWYVEVNQPASVPHVGRLAVAEHAYPLWQQNFGMDSLFLLIRLPVPELHPIGAQLGHVITLQGAAVAVEAPGYVAVRLVWKADATPRSAYTVFVHLDSPAAHLVAQQDNQPVMGLRPTNTWRIGDVVEDNHALLLPKRLPDGDYAIHVGLYHGQQRLALADGTNQITIGLVHSGA